MTIALEIKQNFLLAGSDPEIANMASTISATLLHDANSFYEVFLDNIVGMLEQSPKDLVEKGRLPVEVVGASNNFVVHKAYCRIVENQLEPQIHSLLNELSGAIYHAADKEQDIGTTKRDALFEAVTGGIGSLHPSVAVPPGIMTFLNMPLVVAYPEAFSDLVDLTSGI